LHIPPGTMDWASQVAASASEKKTKKPTMRRERAIWKKEGGVLGGKAYREFKLQENIKKERSLER